MANDIEDSLAKGLFSQNPLVNPVEDFNKRMKLEAASQQKKVELNRKALTDRLTHEFNVIRNRTTGEIGQDIAVSTGKAVLNAGQFLYGLGNAASYALPGEKTLDDYLGNFGSNFEQSKQMLDQFGSDKQKAQNLEAQIRMQAVNAAAKTRMDENIANGMEESEAKARYFADTAVNTLRSVGDLGVFIASTALESADSLLGAAAVGKFAANKALKKTLVKGIQGTPAGQALQKAAATRAAVVYTGLTEGVSNGMEARNAIFNASETKLKKDSPTYRKLREGGKTHTQAQQEMANDAFAEVALRSGLISAGITKFIGAGAFEGNLFTKVGGGELGKILGGVAKSNTARAISSPIAAGGKEFIEEFAQSGSGEYIQNVSKQKRIDENINPIEGTGSQASVGGLAGLATGGVASIATNNPLNAVISDSIQATEAVVKKVNYNKTYSKEARADIKAGTTENFTNPQSNEYKPFDAALYELNQGFPKQSDFETTDDYVAASEATVERSKGHIDAAEEQLSSVIAQVKKEGPLSKSEAAQVKTESDKILKARDLAERRARGIKLGKEAAVNSLIDKVLSPNVTREDFQKQMKIILGATRADTPQEDTGPDTNRVERLMKSDKLSDDQRAELTRYVEGRKNAADVNENILNGGRDNNGVTWRGISSYDVKYGEALKGKDNEAPAATVFGNLLTFAGRQRQKFEDFSRAKEILAKGKDQTSEDKQFLRDMAKNYTTRVSSRGIDTLLDWMGLEAEQFDTSVKEMALKHINNFPKSANQIDPRILQGDLSAEAVNNTLAALPKVEAEVETADELKPASAVKATQKNKGTKKTEPKKAKKADKKKAKKKQEPKKKAKKAAKNTSKKTEEKKPVVKTAQEKSDTLAKSYPKFAETLSETADAGTNFDTIKAFDDRVQQVYQNIRDQRGESPALKKATQKSLTKEKATLDETRLQLWEKRFPPVEKRVERSTTAPTTGVIKRTESVVVDRTEDETAVAEAPVDSTVAERQAKPESEGTKVKNPRTINIFFGSNENKKLSNLFKRKFNYKGKEYLSVEHAYQTWKSGSFDEHTYSDARWKTQNKVIGNSRVNRSKSYSIMKQIIANSLEQNPQFQKDLLATGDTRLTHTQDKAYWGKAFPKIMMELRQEIQEAIAQEAETKVEETTEAKPETTVEDDTTSKPSTGTKAAAVRTDDKKAKKAAVTAPATFTGNLEEDKKIAKENGYRPDYSRDTINGVETYTFTKKLSNGKDHVVKYENDIVTESLPLEPSDDLTDVIADTLARQEEDADAIVPVFEFSDVETEESFFTSVRDLNKMVKNPKTKSKKLKKFLERNLLSNLEDEALQRMTAYINAFIDGDMTLDTFKKKMTTITGAILRQTDGKGTLGNRILNSITKNFKSMVRSTGTELSAQRNMYDQFFELRGNFDLNAVLNNFGDFFGQFDPETGNPSQELLDFMGITEQSDIDALKMLNGAEYEFRLAFADTVNTPTLENIHLDNSGFMQFATKIAEPDETVDVDTLNEYFDSNFVSALFLTSMQYINATGGKTTNSDIDINTILKRDKRTIVDYKERQLYRKIGKPIPTMVNMIGQDMMNELGFRPKKDAESTLNDYAKDAMGMMAVRTLNQMGLLDVFEVDSSTINEVTDNKFTEALEGTQTVDSRFKKTYFARIKTKRDSAFTGKERFDNLPVGVEAHEDAQLFLDVVGSKLVDGTNLLDSISNVANTKETGVHYERIRPIPTRTSKTKQRIAPAMMKALEILNGTGNTVNIDSLGPIESFLGWEILPLLEGGFTEDEIEAMHIIAQDNVLGLQQGTERDMEALKTLVEDLKTKATADKTTFDKILMYFNHFVQSNGRIGVESNTVNPQQSNMHRVFVSPAGSRQIVNVTESSLFEKDVDPTLHRNFLKAVLVHFGEDKLPKDAIYEDKLEELTGFNLTAEQLAKSPESLRSINFAIRTLQEYFKNPEGYKTTEKQKKNIQDAFVMASRAFGEKTLSYQGMVEYAKYRNAVENGNAEFDTDISLEVDGVTNGSAWSLLQFSLGMTREELEDKLRSVGIYPENDFDFFGDYKAAGNDDQYNQFIDAWRNRIDEVIDNLITNKELPFESSRTADFYDRFQKNIFAAMNKIGIKKPEDQTETLSEVIQQFDAVFGKVIRLRAKDWVMQGNYQAGIASLMRNEMRKVTFDLHHAAAELQNPKYKKIGLDDEVRKEYDELLQRYEEIAQFFDAMNAAGYSMLDMEGNKFTPYKEDGTLKPLEEIQNMILSYPSADNLSEMVNAVYGTAAEQAVADEIGITRGNQEKINTVMNHSFHMWNIKRNNMLREIYIANRKKLGLPTNEKSLGKINPANPALSGLPTYEQVTEIDKELQDLFPVVHTLFSKELGNEYLYEFGLPATTPTSGSVQEVIGNDLQFIQRYNKESAGTNDNTFSVGPAGNNIVKGDRPVQIDGLKSTNGYFKMPTFLAPGVKFSVTFVHSHDAIALAIALNNIYEKNDRNLDEMPLWLHDAIKQPLTIASWGAQEINKAFAFVNSQHNFMGEVSERYQSILDKVYSNTQDSKLVDLAIKEMTARFGKAAGEVEKDIRNVLADFSEVSSGSTISIADQQAMHINGIFDFIKVWNQYSDGNAQVVLAENFEQPFSEQAAKLNEQFMSSQEMLDTLERAEVMITENVIYTSVNDKDAGYQALNEIQEAKRELRAAMLEVNSDNTLAFASRNTDNISKLIQSRVKSKNKLVNQAIKDAVENEGGLDIITGSERKDGTKFKAKTTEKLTSANLNSIFDKLYELYDKNNPNQGDHHSSYLRDLVSDIGGRLARPLQLNIDERGKRNRGYYDEASGAINLTAATKSKEAVNNLSMTATEVYSHELVHGSTLLALVNDSPEKKRLVQIYEHFRKNGSPELFMDPDIGVNDPRYAAMKKNADRAWGYVFANPEVTRVNVTNPITKESRKVTIHHGIHEFMAYGKTNEIFRKNIYSVPVPKAKDYKGRSWILHIDSMFQKLLSWLGNRLAPSDVTAGHEVDFLFHHLSSIQHQQATKVGQMMNKVEDSYTGAVKQIFDNTVKPVADVTGKLLRKSNNNFVKAAGYFLSFPEESFQQMEEQFLRLEKELEAANVDMENFIMSSINETVGLTDRNRYLGNANRKTKQIVDGIRHNLKEAAIQSARESFVADSNQNLTKEQKQALGALLRIDTQALLTSNREVSPNKYDSQTIEDLLRDDALLRKYISQVEKEIAQRFPKQQEFYNRMSYALGEFMYTGKSPYNIIRVNAAQIAGMYETGIKAPTGNNLNRAQVLIDELSSLHALAYVNNQERQTILDIMAAENQSNSKENGIVYMLGMHNYLQNKSRSKLFNGEMLMRKGYVRQTLDDSIDIRFGTLEEEDALAQQGFTRVTEALPRDDLDPTKYTDFPKIFIYKSEVMTDNGWIGQAMPITGMGRKGTSIQQTHSQAGIYNASQTAKRAFKTMKSLKGDYAKWIARGEAKGRKAPSGAVTTPVFNEMGDIVDYTYEMTEQARQEILRKDNAYDLALGSTAGNIEDKVQSKVLSLQLMDALYEDYQKNFTDNPGRFVAIGPRARKEKHREIWNLMPDHVKEKAIQLWGKSEIIVPAKDVSLIFGQRKGSVANLTPVNTEHLEGADKIVAEVNNLAALLLNNYTGRMLEGYGKSFVKMAKDTIVIKSGTTLYFNILSNIYLLKSMGVPLKDILAGHKMVFVEGAKYHEKEMQIEKLKLKRGINPTGKSTKALDDEIARLEAELSQSPLDELIKAYTYQSIVEDIATNDTEYGAKDRIERLVRRLPMVDAILDNVPDKVKRAGEYAVMAHNTPLYQFMKDMTQLSDFAGRYILYQHLTKKEGKSGEEAHNLIMDMFVDYDLPTHPVWQYGNEIGLTVFTKFFFRIQKVNLYLLRNKLPNILSLLLLEQFTGIDAPSILDENPLDYATRLTTPIGLLDTPITELATFKVMPY